MSPNQRNKTPSLVDRQSIAAYAFFKIKDSRRFSPGILLAMTFRGAGLIFASINVVNVGLKTRTCFMADTLWGATGRNLRVDTWTLR